MPMILERRVIPWRGGRGGETFLIVVLAAAVTLAGAQTAAAPAIARPTNVNCLRFASLNIHSGYSLLFADNLEMVENAIRRNGADVALLQEVDTGRMSSFGVDQAEWLGRRLGMEVAFFPQDEHLRGLAVLSRIPIRSVGGEKLSSDSAQAGVMHIELDLDTQPFHVYNVWLGYRTTDANGRPLPDNLQDQNRQTAELQQMIAAEHGPAFADRIVLGGTFNYDVDSNLYRLWAQTTFVDPFIGLAKERAKTLFLVDGTAARFDYIWLMNLTPSGVGIDLDTVVSDHRMSVVQVSRAPGLQCR
jgi:endonuclease/exonuclease/phosphatase family metal-dependent hydrolase